MDFLVWRPPELSEAQARALTTAQHVFVQAAAGSGKTTILVSRYLKILDENPEMELDRILAITFTEEAAREMMARLRLKTGRSLGKACISTIHGFCRSVLSRFSIEADVDPGFEVLDETRANELIRQAISHVISDLEETQDTDFFQLALHHSAAQISEQLFSAVKKRGCPDDLAKVTDVAHRHYQKLKRALGVVDFDDLIIKTHAVLAGYPHVRQYYQDALAYIMVDEFQDTDQVQWDIIQLLLPNGLGSVSPNLFVVGDVKQSIYSFRGADHTVFQSVLDTFNQTPNTLIVNANDNYRCAKPVADFINAVFQPLFEPHIPYLPLVPHRAKAPGSVQCVFVEEDWSLYARFEQILGWAASLHANGVAYDDMALLFRKKQNLSLYQKWLIEAGVPAQIHGGLGFFQRQEIVDLVNVMRALNNPSDRLSWNGLLGSPLYVDSAHLAQWLAQRDTQNPRMLLESVLTQSGAWSRYAGQSDGPQVIANIRKFLNLVEVQLSVWHRLWGDMETYFTHCVLHNRTEPEAEISQGKAVHLMTIHGAKGLEFSAVTLPELDTRFNLKDGDPVAAIEEEKRIFYVACTRAKDHLLLMGVPRDKSMMGLAEPFLRRVEIQQ